MKKKPAAEEQVEDKLKSDYQTRFTVFYLCFGTIARDISLMPRLALVLPSLSFRAIIFHSVCVGCWNAFVYCGFVWASVEFRSM